MMDVIFKELKLVGALDELKKITDIETRHRRLNEIVSQLNITKVELTFYLPEEQLYLCARLQSKGIDMGICPFFYIFFSTRNKKFHHACLAANKIRTHCLGITKRCEQGMFDLKGLPFAKKQE